MNHLRKSYNRQLAQLNNPKMLKFILDQITGRDIQVTTQEDLRDEILEANYSLT